MAGAAWSGVVAHRLGRKWLGRKRFFFEKKQQKTSVKVALGRCRRPRPRPRVSKSFAAFFSKKAVLSWLVS
jgi:hypothetical protein